LLGDKDLYYAGWLLSVINLSDLAAAGAVPLGLVMNYTLPRSTTIAQFERLLDGVDDCAHEHGTKVVGGDLRDGESLQLSGTAVGQCVRDRRLGRTPASAGDCLLLVGSPGYLWSAALVAGNRATLAAPDAARVRERARKPVAQLAAGRLLVEAGFARAAMDVSDGLFATVRTLCEANGLGVRMTSNVHLDPIVASVCEQAGVRPFDLAATWGDWCLVVVVREHDVASAIGKLAAESIMAQRIGTLVDRGGITLVDEDKQAEWLGVAQERFSDRSWHGRDLDRWMADLISGGATA
jgi:thiamine-monophosphate kinase